MKTNKLVSRFNGACKYCGKGFIGKLYANGIKTLYCSNRCTTRGRKKPSRNPLPNWNIIGYDLLYLYDIYDEFTDEDCTNYGMYLDLVKDMKSIYVNKLD